MLFRDNGITLPRPSSWRDYKVAASLHRILLICMSESYEACAHLEPSCMKKKKYIYVKKWGRTKFSRVFVISPSFPSNVLEFPGRVRGRNSNAGRVINNTVGRAWSCFMHSNREWSAAICTRHPSSHWGEVREEKFRVCSIDQLSINWRVRTWKRLWVSKRTFWRKLSFDYILKYIGFILWSFYII